MVLVCICMHASNFTLMDRPKSNVHIVTIIVWWLPLHRFTLRRVLDYLVSTVGYFYYFGMSNGLAVDILFACINLS